ncbi:MAG: hypothetical protein RLZZ563_2107, partial [Pseudomonadota bacterium]
AEEDAAIVEHQARLGNRWAAIARRLPHRSANAVKNRWHCCLRRRVQPTEPTLGTREVGAGGHYFGCQHTQERYSTAFYAPFVSDWRNYEAWQQDGSHWTPERAHRIYKQILDEFEAPEMNGDHQEDLRRFVARRKQEGGAPTDF